MKKVTARELKNQTGRIISEARKGEHYIVTVHGKPAAAIVPAGSLAGRFGALRPPEEAWSDIDAALTTTEPEFETSEKATRWVRKIT